MFGFRNWVTFSINFLFLLSFVTCGKRGKKGRRFGGKSPSWISVKKAEETYELNATHLCHGGAWLPDPIFVDCVCVRGIWALSTDFCDRNTTIYTGDGHCFQIKKVKNGAHFILESPQVYYPFRKFENFLTWIMTKRSHLNLEIT